jgi:uncharacterized repeat protein (TIGR03803 family)
LTTIYSFCAQPNCSDGANPYGPLIQATDGSFYGTTTLGGIGAGTIFRITPEGTLTTLHSFVGYPTDGANPSGPLIQARDGNFYGTTAEGGAFGYCNSGCGTVFKITTRGILTTLHSFAIADGYSPTSSALVQGADGSLYGTTPGGGASSNCGGLGCGTVFKITTRGTLTTLHSFAIADGNYPDGTLIQATDGNFYGTTSCGGAYAGARGSCPIGSGTVFKITPGGALTTVYSFCAQPTCSDGANPIAGLVQATDGDFYGTTEGGTNNGTVFSLSVGLSAFVRTLPTSGKVGTAVKILGTKLTGASSVSFNGTAAVFKVLSSSEITTTVPAGATTGTVQVVRPGGTLSSNVNFRVP